MTRQPAVPPARTKNLEQRRRSRLPALLATTALVGTAFAVLPAGSASASSHREAPLVAGTPKLDATDTYAFVSPDKPDTVTILGNFQPFEEPSGGPNFYPWSDDAKYDINIDNNGDAKADITYEFTFRSAYQDRKSFLYNTGAVTSLTDPDLNFRQTYSVRRIDADGRSKLLRKADAAPSDVGAASMPDYGALRDGAVQPVAGGGHVFAGQADDPFFLDLRIFDLLYGGNLSEVGNDTLHGYNVNTLGIQIPKSQLTAGGDPVIGVWTSVLTENSKGRQVSVSRLGSPLVNEAVLPVKEKDVWNASVPSGDAQFGKYVLDPEVPKLVQSIYGIPAPATPRNDLAQVFLTGVPGLTQPKKVTPSEELRLNTAVAPSATPNRLGVLKGDLAGFPNGRRLGDDVVDISLQALEGALLPGHAAAVDGLGDGVDANDKAFGTTFPYVALPWSGSVTRPGPQGATSFLTGARPTGSGSPAGGLGEPVALGSLGLLALLGAGVAVRRRRTALPA
ncbi:uncharacterized protein DUF4331 [Motilibacter peucedani]|uniref:Uncharacterized protein DUF4331 n=1 Tax=Motilibacter peucedani TaxID=598650 RepID=A0A420XL00_9ACTN|nr:DUF4331 domain-containing protein [Motilibacter peucedani]RKS69223.1 uncharacterized protein DUF4331 [Motilibacter peucedani]